MSASILLSCSGSSPASTPLGASPMTCAACACTASSSASRKHTATASPPSASAPPCSVPGSTTALSSRPALQVRTSPLPEQSATPRLPSTNGISTQNSQPENLTQLLHRPVIQVPSSLSDSGLAIACRANGVLHHGGWRDSRRLLNLMNTSYESVIVQSRGERAKGGRVTRPPRHTSVSCSRPW